MDVRPVIESARRSAKEQGATYVRLQHLTTDEVEQLARETMTFLRSRGGVPSEAVSGWRRLAASQTGVLAAWVSGMDLSEDERKRLRPLRTEVYDLLQERGLVFKPPGTGSSIHVSPSDEAATHDFPHAPPGKPAYTKRRGAPNHRDQVENELRARVQALVGRIRSELSLDATDYWAIVTSERPLDVVVRLIWGPAEKGTFHELIAAGRLDLSLDAAVTEWSADLPLQTDLVEQAQARHNYFTSSID